MNSRISRFVIRAGHKRNMRINLLRWFRYDGGWVRVDSLGLVDVSCAKGGFLIVLRWVVDITICAK